MHGINSISVLGCGWLGFPLAVSLINKGYSVKGSTTSIERLPLLFKERIEPFLVQFRENCVPENLAEFLKSDILIIAVPPGRSSFKYQSYFDMLNTLTKVLPDGSIQKIIFISSTSVYGDQNRTVTERDKPEPDTEVGKRIFAAEQIILSMQVKHIIVRLSGLIGPGRHPGRFLTGKPAVANGLAPTNLIHLEDAIGIINELITNDGTEGIYIAAAPSHPSKQSFYTLASQTMGFDPPQFIPEKIKWKGVESVRIGDELKYKFLVPDLMQWLQDND